MRLASKFPRLVDVLDVTVGGQAVRSIVASQLSPLQLTLDEFVNHYRRRRINARADDPTSADDVAEAVGIWLCDIYDAQVEAAQLAGLSADYATVIKGGLTDDGRVEVRTLYAAPNGITPPDAKIGEEKLTVSGEYAEGLDRAAKLAEVQSFKFLLLDKFEPCFLGVV